MIDDAGNSRPMTPRGMERPEPETNWNVVGILICLLAAVVMMFIEGVAKL